MSVENLNVNSPSKLTGDGNGGWLRADVLGQDEETDVLTLHDINVSVEEEIQVDFEGQIVMTGSTIFDSIGILLLFALKIGAKAVPQSTVASQPALQ